MEIRKNPHGDVESMRVLHVWDCAGVGAILAKYQRKLGVFAEVVKRSGFNQYGIDIFYRTKILKCGVIMFYLMLIPIIRRYDVIHFHGCDVLAVIARLFRKKVVMHFHGSELRDKKIVCWFWSLFAHVSLVSSPDLLDIMPKSIWLSAIVDTEHFYKRKCEKEGKFVPHKRMRGKYKVYVKYQDLPEYLSKYRIFKQLGWKKQALSKLSLECLPCGLTVLWNGLEIKGKLPKRHEPLNVAKKTLRIYESF